MTAVPEHGWRCFHCGETFTEAEAAAEHFGTDMLRDPSCIERLTHSDEALLRRMHEAEEYAHANRLECDAAEAVLSKIDPKIVAWARELVEKPESDKKA